MRLAIKAVTAQGDPVELSPAEAREIAAALKEAAAMEDAD
jgi:hypothetical protein